MKVDVLAATQPKSDQLNADDLIDGPRTFTITGVRQGNQEQPIICDLAEYNRPYKPCKSMLRVMVAAWSNDSQKWHQQKITLYCDPEVIYAGVKVGGIRISYMTGIAEPMELMLTVSRSKRKPHHVDPITEKPYPQSQFDKNLPKWGEAVKAGTYTTAQIIARCMEKGTLTSAQIEAIEALNAEAHGRRSRTVQPLVGSLDGDK